MVAELAALDTAVELVLPLEEATLFCELPVPAELRVLALLATEAADVEL